MTSPLQRAIRKAYWRLLPLLFLSYVVAYVDRTNVAFAKLTMAQTLPGFDNAVFGFGAGVFFFGYFLLEVPGTIIVERWSARRWLARIMISWGIVAGCTALVHTPTQFYVMRFLLGLAEAGFFPGVIVFLTHWFPRKERARALALFFVASPVAQIVSPRLCTALLSMGTDENLPQGTVHHLPFLGLQGWQWIYVIGAIPAIVLGLAVWRWLVDQPAKARWLDADEAAALGAELDAERRAAGTLRHRVWDGLGHPKVLLLCVAFFANVTANYGIEFFLPTILDAWYHVDYRSLAWLVTVPALLTMVMQPLVGWSSDRLQERRWHVVLPLILGVSALVLTPLTRGHLGLTILCFTVAGTGLKAYLPAFFALPNMFMTASAAAASIGLINSVGNLGGWLGPSLLGRIEASTHSFVGGIYCLCASMVVAICIIAFLRFDRPGSQSGPDTPR